MTLGTAVDAPSRVPVRSRLELVWRWVLVVAWLAVLALLVTTGQRDSTWQELRHDVRSGDAHDIWMTHGLPGNAHGSSTVEVTWRDGLLGYRATVTEARPPRGPAPVVPDVVAALRDLDPDVEVAHHRWADTSSSVLGWRVSDWTGFLALTLFLATIMLLITQPAPWRATRWAWFWLITVASPIGLAAFLLLSGPTGVLPAPREPRRRLTGGWALLLALLVSAVSDAVVVGIA